LINTVPEIKPIKTTYRPNQIGFSTHSDASIKPNDYLAGFGIITRDGKGLPIGVMLSWEQARTNSSLAIETIGMMKSLNICLAEGYKDMCFMMDAKYVVELIQDLDEHERFKEEHSEIILDADTVRYIYYAHPVLTKSGLKYIHVPRELNSPADFLANNARNLQLDGWPNPRKYQDLQDVHITEHDIYMRNSMPVGLKGILIDDMGLSRVITKTVTGTMNAIEVIMPLIDDQPVLIPNMLVLAKWKRGINQYEYLLLMFTELVLH
jgi:ribonuclease HI